MPIHWISPILILATLSVFKGGESASVEETHLCQGLRAHYRFDEGEGLNISDSIEEGNIGTIKLVKDTNASLWAQHGRIGSGIRFNKDKTHYVSLPATSLWNSTESTVVIWVKLDDVVLYQYILYADVVPFPSGGEPERRRHDLWVLGTPNFDLKSEIWTKDMEKLDMTVPQLSSGSWHQVAAVKNETHYGVFLDGVLRASREAESIVAVPHEVKSIWIGGRPGPEYDEEHQLAVGSEGIMDELMYYDRPLSDRELQMLQNATLRTCLLESPVSPTPSASITPTITSTVTHTADPSATAEVSPTPSASTVSQTSFPSTATHTAEPSSTAKSSPTPSASITPAISDTPPSSRATHTAEASETQPSSTPSMPDSNAYPSISPLPPPRPRREFMQLLVQYPRRSIKIV